MKTPIMRYTVLTALFAGVAAAQPAKTTQPPPKTQAAPPAGQAKAPAGQAKQPATPPAGTQKTVTPPKTATPPAGQAKAVQPPAGQTKAATTTTPAPQGTGRGAVPTAPRDTAIPVVMMREVFDYSRDGRRDPFISLLTTTDLRPTLRDLKLLMTVVDEPGRSVALVQDAYDRKQKTLRVGSRLGRMRVSSIRADAVIFTIEEFGMNRRDSLLLRDSTRARGR